MLRPYLLHPAIVHFPIALLLGGLAAQAGSLWPRGRAALAPVASSLLWAGTLAVWAAVGTGLLAERTAPHVPPAWEVMAEHKELALWTCGAFTLLALGSIYLKRRLPFLLLILWLAAAGLLVVTAQHGGRLVYDFGLGVGRN
jgi:uncharacterized membrane protein